MTYEFLVIDDPAPFVRRITMRAILRREVLEALRDADRDEDVRVTIVRGAGTNFGAGDAGEDGAPADPTTVWDLAKPVIAQVHGECLDGGAELATGCDLVYVAEDARIGTPSIDHRAPDMQYHAWLFGMRGGMEAMLTGESFTGTEAVALGWANRAFPASELDDQVLGIASRIAQVPADLLQINKRTVHRAMEIMGIRASLRQGSELAALSKFTARG